ncbi:uncharacterized protein LOC108036166 isoform X2 [Drosophila biarmipes]|uniref:uncharacterized protein LOC108036166 isoform X2 n=1 Tax=Drosophila biarmipes TaxID=125945 RepID=UPI0021CC5144|nr:uncharacterized protein LOC108036166 isoform X2 [Drosophila biarmipes]
MGKSSGADLDLPVASWHRGLSIPQMQAADDLGAALGYNIGGIRDCLLRLGLRPLVRNRQLLRIVQLSRGQKLAFLYFLFQEHYNTGGSCGEYTVNGQLLLSAVAYLDLPATFRALDKVLPLNKNRASKSNTPPDIQKASRRPSCSTSNQSTFKTLSPKDIENKMPLDLRATFRELGRVLSSQLAQQNQTVSPGIKVKPYFQKQPRPKSFRRPTHFSSNSPLYEVQIPNEVGDPREDEDRWFANFQFHPVQRTVKAVINHELCHLFDQIDEAPSDPPQDPRDLCEFHEETRSQERRAFLLKQRLRYLEMIDLEGTEKRLTRERIINHLERDVDEYLLKFGDKGWSPGVPAFRKPDCAACNELVHVGLDTPPQVLLLEGEWGRLYDRSGPKLRLCAGEDGNQKFQKSKKKPEYFTAPGGHRPYAFNYARIFEEGSKQSLNTKEAIGNSLVKSIEADDDDDDAEREIRIPRTVRSSHINEAICRCVRKIFEKSLLTAPCVMTPKNSKERLVYDRKRIDPDDEKFMDQMLSDAFNILRRDTSLVLASLPDGHQLPQLREWIRRRFGKRYGPQTEVEADKLAHKMQNLSEMERQLAPLMANIDPRMVRQNPVPFALYDEIMAAANKFKKSFREQVLQIILKQTRLCWQAQHNLRAYNSSGLRRTFFTYLPSSSASREPTFSLFLASKNA